MYKKILFFIIFIYTAFVYADTKYNMMYNVIFNNGNFIAGGDEYSGPYVPTIKISQDGKTWKDSYIDPTNSDSAYNQVFGISCNRNVCVASLAFGKSVLYSNDNGLTWKYVRHGFNNNSYGAVTNGAYKFVMAVSNNILYSYDGLSWYQALLPARSQGYYYFNGALAYGNNMFLAISKLSGSYPALLSSSDGINWSMVNTANTPISQVYYVDNVIFADTAFYFTSGLYNGLIYTPDLIYYGVENPTQEFPFLEYHNNIMFGVVNSQHPASSINALSYDLGKTWGPSLGNRNPAMVLNHFAYGNNVYVYIDGGKPQYSYDAINWVETNW